MSAESLSVSSSVPTMSMGSMVAPVPPPPLKVNGGSDFIRPKPVKPRVKKEKTEGQRRVPIWNRVEQRKISGFASPMEKNLAEYLKKNPHCEVYVKKPKSRKETPATPGNPNSIGYRPPFSDGSFMNGAEESTTPFFEDSMAHGMNDAGHIHPERMNESPSRTMNYHDFQAFQHQQARGNPSGNNGIPQHLQMQLHDELTNMWDQNNANFETKTEEAYPMFNQPVAASRSGHSRAHSLVPFSDHGDMMETTMVPNTARTDSPTSFQDYVNPGNDNDCFGHSFLNENWNNTPDKEVPNVHVYGEIEPSENTFADTASSMSQPLQFRDRNLCLDDNWNSLSTSMDISMSNSGAPSRGRAGSMPIPVNVTRHISDTLDETMTEYNMGGPFY